MTREHLEAEVLICMENAASIGKSGQPYLDYCKRLTAGIMKTIDKYKETETGIETVEEK